MAKGRTVGFFSFRKILIKQMKTYFHGNPNITIGTIQKYGKQEVKVDLAIFDEKDFHDAKLKNNIKSNFSITLSGTPVDGYGSALEFDDIIDVIQIPDLIELGLAKPIKVIGSNIVDTTNLKRNKTDFLPKESYDLMSSSTIQKDMISIYKKHCIGRKTIMFAINIQHAEELKMAFLDVGIKCDVTHSKKDDEAITAFENGEFDLLINVAQLTTGYDFVEINCVFFARPMASIPLFIQCVGRGIRLNPARPDDNCLVVDCANVVTDTVHPLQRLRFDKEKRDRKDKKCKCGGVLSLLKRETTKPNSDGFYTVKTTKICKSCSKYYEDEETAMLPIKPCGCSADNKVIMEQTDKEAIFYLECQGCGAKEDYRKILLTDAELEEIKPSDLGTWEHVRRELRKATNKDGKKYHWMWSEHVIDNLKERGAKPDMIIKEIERYNLNGWKLGGLAHAVKIL